MNPRLSLSPVALGRQVSRLVDLRLAPLALAADADAGFDGGEWSGPAWSETFVEEEDRAVVDFARLAGLPVREVRSAFLLHSYSQRPFPFL